MILTMLPFQMDLLILVSLTMPQHLKMLLSWGSCKQFVWWWVEEVRNLRQETAECCIKEQSNVFVISKSFEVYCLLPVIWFILSFRVLERFYSFYFWSKGRGQTCNQSDGLKKWCNEHDGEGECVSRSLIANKNKLQTIQFVFHSHYKFLHAVECAWCKAWFPNDFGGAIMGDEMVAK